MTYDALVIGGGITGAGILRDLALRGIKALLVEKGRPARGTTANSSHLIHGGLRYLLYDRLTTRTTCWDSGNIVRIARPLLTRLPILWPVYRGHTHGIETVETLLEEYDRFSKMKYGLPHLRLSPEAALRVFPKLKAEGLKGALVFDEWWVNPEALVRANLDAALRSGADVRLETEVLALERAGGALAGARLRLPDGREETVAARAVVNAAGPWADRVARLGGAQVPLRLRQGTHLAYGKLDFLAAAGRPTGLILEAADRGRYVFVLPHGKITLVGPTDVATESGPDALRSTEEEKKYLLDSVRRYFPDFPGRWESTLVGARPILGRAGPEKLLSREFEILDHAPDGAPGFFTAAGGKMSDFRLMAEAAGDAAARFLGRPAPCLTRRVTLEGRPAEAAPAEGLPSAALKRLLRAHPRLRELHALGALGAAYLRHWVRPRRRADFDEFRRHYA